MRRQVIGVICAITCLAWFVPVAAQEGHPLTGTWTGEWGPTTARTRITIAMKWDGKKVDGTINPGPESIPIGRVSVDYDKWLIRIEADAKDAAGKLVRIVAEGVLDDIGSSSRTISGTWTQGSAKGTFRLTRT